MVFAGIVFSAIKIHIIAASEAKVLSQWQSNT